MAESRTFDAGLFYLLDSLVRGAIALMILWTQSA